MKQKQRKLGLLTLFVAVIVVAVILTTLRPGASVTPQKIRGSHLYWSIAGTAQHAAPVPFTGLQGKLITLHIRDMSFSRQPSPITSLAMSCHNPDTDETQIASIQPLLTQDFPQERVVQFDLNDVITNLPYPIDAGNLESKPGAIIAQKAGRSTYDLSSADLRKAFNDTAEYMMETAGHHYALPIGDGELQCFFGAELLDGKNGNLFARASSSPLDISFGRGLPEGTFSRDYTQPRPEHRPTWVVDQNFVPQLVPPSTSTKAVHLELNQLLKMQTQRSAKQIGEIRYWDNGSAIGPWIEVALSQMFSPSTATNPVLASRALALTSVALNDATVVGLREEWKYKRLGPCSIEPRLKPIGGSCSNLSFPSEHAVAAGEAYTMLT